MHVSGSSYVQGNQGNPLLIQEGLKIGLLRASYNIDKELRVVVRVKAKAASQTACLKDNTHILKTVLQVSKSLF